MTRVHWRLMTLAVAALTVAAAWFALNGVRIARPGPGALSAVELPAEAPTLPPSEPGPPLAPAPLGRALFGPTGDPLVVGDVASRVARELPGPAARTVIAPSPAQPTLIDVDMMQARAIVGAFDVALSIPQPHHDQYFGASMVPEESRAPDPQGPPQPGDAAGASGAGSQAAPADPAGAAAAGAAEGATTDQAAAVQGPDYAPKPAPNPRRGTETDSDSDQPAEPPEPQIVVAPGETAPDVAAAATSQAALPPESTGPDGMILLGVFRGSGSSRALVRTATESARQVVPGDEINGWRVSSIGEDHIRLRRASQTRMLKLPGSP